MNIIKYVCRWPTYISTLFDKTAAIKYKLRNHDFAIPLSSAEASLCCVETGEKEKRGIVPRALSIFGIPSKSLCEEKSRYTKI